MALIDLQSSRFPWLHGGLAGRGRAGRQRRRSAGRQARRVGPDERHRARVTEGGQAAPPATLPGYPQPRFVVHAVALVAGRRVRGVKIARWIRGNTAGWLLFAVVGIDRLVARRVRPFNLASAFRHRDRHRPPVHGDGRCHLDAFEAAAPRTALYDPNRSDLLQDPYIRTILPAAGAPLSVAPAAERARAS